MSMNHVETLDSLPIVDRETPALKPYLEETLRSETKVAGFIYRAEHHVVQMPDGSEAERELVFHRGGSAVAVVDDEGYTWLVAQYRKALERFIWEIPAGKLDANEDPIVTATRELKEETGITAGKMTYLGPFAPTPGYNNEIIHLYYASDLTIEASQPDPGEYLRLIRLPLDAAIEAIQNNEIIDAKTCYALLYVWNLRKGMLHGQ